MLKSKLVRKSVSGREIVVSDDFADAPAIARIAALLEGLEYRRTEKSRPDTPVSAEAAEISDAMIAAEPFFRQMKAFGEAMFPAERFAHQRLYVNRAMHGDTYYPHRDCPTHMANITVLYYANPVWQEAWGGETIFYDDAHEAQLEVIPRPGRILVSRGAILHKAGTPTSLCTVSRFTIAYKLAVSWL